MSNRAASAVATGAIFQPGVITSAPVQRRTILFNTSATTGSTSITRACLLSLFFASNGGANVVTPLWSSVRIRKIQIWSGNGAGPVQFAWKSDVGLMRSQTKSFLGHGPITPFVAAPPPGSRSSMWSAANALAATLSEVLFELDYDLGSTSEMPPVLYLQLDLDVNESDLAISSINASAAPAGGSGVFYAALDNLTTANVVGGWTFMPAGFKTYTSPPTSWARTG
jgi:hypothetical protein